MDYVIEKNRFYLKVSFKGALLASAYSDLINVIDRAILIQRVNDDILLLDFSKITMLTSIVINAVNSKSGEMKAHKLKLAILAPDDEIYSVLELIGFDKLFPVYRTLSDFEEVLGSKIKKSSADLSKEKKTILIVDDEPEIRELIADFLKDDEGYNIKTAVDGVDALENILPNNHFDLIISDINMPRMKGFELLEKVRSDYPHMKRVLITAYNVEDYLELAMEHDIGNIFVKTTPFNFDELSVLLNNLLTNNIFGAYRYFTNEPEKKTFLIRTGEALDLVARDVVTWLPTDVRNARKLELVLVELFTNAIFYGIRGEAPDRKETWAHDFILAESESIKVTILKDNEKYAISVLDNGGKLQKKDVLYWLHRQIKTDDTGLPLGVMDSHGRGFFIARKYIDRLLINISQGKKTEIVIINYFSETYSGFKPLHINEI